MVNPLSLSAAFFLLFQKPGTKGQSAFDLGSFRDALRDLASSFLHQIPYVAVGILVFLIFVVTAVVVRRLMRETGAHTRLPLNVAMILGRLVSSLIMVLGAFVAAVVIFPAFKPGDLVAGLGITSVAIGFAFKDTLQNFFAGILILWRQPFVVGDQIRVRDFEGTVEEINMRSTRLLTYDGERVILPNGSVYVSPILVRTAFPHRRIRFLVGIGYPDSVEHARAVILDVLAKTDGVLGTPASHVYLTELGGSSVNFTVFFWVNSRQASALAVSDRVATGIKLALDKANIDMPYPHCVVLLHDQSGSRPVDPGILASCRRVIVLHARLLAIWSTLRSAYWFIPTVMALGAIALAFSSVKLDEFVRGDVAAKLGWVYSGGPEGARAVLATIAGSIITVAGTTFSVTIAAFSLASSQFGPRLLRTFRRDTGNQIVLGTFIATFLYCLLVLRTIRGTETNTYVPHLSVTLGVLLACFSLAVLIYFIHHTAASIQVSRLIDLVGEELDSAILQNCPTREAGKGERDSGFSVMATEEPCPPTVRARRAGYVVYVDYGGLVGIGTRKNCVIHICVKPGDFIVPGMSLVAALQQNFLDESDRNEIYSTMNLDTDRSPAQDLEFGCLQLAEIAVRALSPGINDPFTAIACIDRISAALCLLEGRELPSPRRWDAHGNIRLVAEVVTYEQLVQAAYLHIRSAARSNAWVLQYLSERITLVLSRTDNPDFQAALLQERALALRDREIAQPGI